MRTKSNHKTLSMKKHYPGHSMLTVAGLIVFVATMFLTSCSGGKQLAYFQNLPDSTIVHLPKVQPEERVIAKGDRLTIQFSAKGGAAEVIGEFNRKGGGGGGSTGGGSGSGSTGGEAGYLVDPDGFLEFPYIGKVKADSLTTRQLKANLTNLSSSYLKDPIVDVEFSTYRITVLGEVRAPGTHNLPMQRTTLFEALAVAGDLPRTAKRYNIQLYRDYRGERTITRFDLRDKAVLNNSRIFQIKPNDVIYVQPSTSSLFKEDFNFITTIVTLLVSLASVGLSVYYNTNK